MGQSVVGWQKVTASYHCVYDCGLTDKKQDQLWPTAHWEFIFYFW